MLFRGVEEIDSVAEDGLIEDGRLEVDHEVGEEIDDGVRLVRRRILKLATAAPLAFGVTMLGRNARADDAPQESNLSGYLNRPVDFDSLVGELRTISKELVAQDAPNEEAYLHGIAGLLSRIDTFPKKDASGRGAFQMAALAQHRPLVIYKIVMKPGATIRIHDHRHYNGVIFGLNGTCKIRNFDIEAEGDEIPPHGEEFTIRETKWAHMGRGGVSTLSRNRDNIHEVVAGKDGAELVDVFTYFDRAARSYPIVFDRKPVDADERLFRAHWGGPPPRAGRK